MSRPTMDAWTARKIGAPFTRKNLEAYQLARLNETLAFVGARSRFYGEKLGEVRLSSLSDIASLPFTYPSDLVRAPYDFLCVSPREASRIVTVPTSGSTGGRKRVFFTDTDLELCADFFHHGMKNLVDESDTVGILFPAAAPGSVGDLLAEGLKRGGTRAFPLFPLADDANALTGAVEKDKITVLAGFPQLMEKLAECRPEMKIRAVLLSADYVSGACRETIRRNWGAEVFEHYGMTEMGLGCAVSCEFQRGGHVREADLLLEIIDPATGKVLPEGEYGEVVFTTLTRRAMPFVRYRTGDISTIIPGPCPCGTKHITLARVLDRGVRKKLPV